MFAFKVRLPDMVMSLVRVVFAVPESVRLPPRVHPSGSKGRVFVPDPDKIRL